MSVMAAWYPCLPQCSCIVHCLQHHLPVIMVGSLKDRKENIKFHLIISLFSSQGEILAKFFFFFKLPPASSWSKPEETNKEMCLELSLTLFWWWKAVPKLFCRLLSALQRAEAPSTPRGEQMPFSHHAPWKSKTTET